MKIKVSIFLILFFTQSIFAAQEFQWARVKFDTKRDIIDKWDIDLQFDLDFLRAVQEMTTLKVDIKVNTVSFENLDEVTKYPLVFIHGEGEPNFSEKEVKNMREYMLRGGFIFADDCVYQKKGDYFFKGMREVLETRVFPEKKLELLPITHEIYHCHFEFPEGLPYIQGVNHGGWGLSDEKGRLMVFLCSTDLHCGWGKDKEGKKWFGEKKFIEACKMGINIIIYALTH
jgi:hypothetical protein